MFRHMEATFLISNNDVIIRSNFYLQIGFSKLATFKLRVPREGLFLHQGSTVSFSSKPKGYSVFIEYTGGTTDSF